MYSTKKIIKNAFRITKVRGETAIRLRVPGGHLEAKYLDMIKELADRFGNGTVHLTTRQGFEIPGVKLKDMDNVKKIMAEMIDEIERESQVVLEEPEAGYPSSGTRNITACIGNRVCQFSCADTTLLAQKIEKAVYPNNYHLKIAVSGCPNDCIKAHVHDIGIISQVVPEYDPERCIACEACLDNCQSRITNSLRLEKYEIIRDEKYCLQCGECILKCPMGAFTWGKKLYRVMIGGRTGKKNPRLANTFIKDATSDVVLAVCRNIYSYIDRFIDKDLPKELLGYIIDRTGFEVFKLEVTRGVELNPEAKVVKLENHGYFYPASNSSTLPNIKASRPI